MTDPITSRIPPQRLDGGRWWGARGLRYNIGLALAGWVAYALFLLLQFSIAPQPDISLRALASMTIILGIGFLLIMAVANALYLLGVLIERFIRPVDLDHYRNSAWTLGFWGSVALPFLFPLGTFAIMQLTTATH